MSQELASASAQEPATSAIHVGDTADGQRVSIPVFHTGVFGQSGVGKTKLLKYMISQVVDEGYRVLIFDSRITGPEFEGIGTEVPFYLEAPLDEDLGTIDPDAFRSLIEGMRTKGKGNMERYRGGFIDVCDGAKTFEDVGKALKAKLENPKIRGSTRVMYFEVKHDYDRLIKLLSKHPFASLANLEHALVRNAIVRMPTWKLPNLALQGVVVRSVVDALLRRAQKLIFLVDEAPNFVSQREYNPAKSSLQDLDEQGRKPQVFGWYSGQTLTGFDKANMKNLWYWIMGREMERNEAEDVFKTQTSKLLKVDEIKTLKVRQFIVSTPDFTKLVTVPEVREKELFAREVHPAPLLIKLQSSPQPLEDYSDLHEKLLEARRELFV